MSPAPVKCPKCQAPLDNGLLNQPELLPCPNCQTRLQVEVFPATGVVYLGIDSIRKLLLFKAVFLRAAALALLCWAIWSAHGLGPILAQPSKFHDSSEFWTFFFPALTGMVGFWATLSRTSPATRALKRRRSWARPSVSRPP